MHKRPVFLNLTQLQFPITAIVSVLHRVSGVLLFLFVPILLWMLQTALRSEKSFFSLQQLFQPSWIKFSVLSFLAIYVYHLLFGLRHIVADLGFGETKSVARGTAWFVFVFVFVAVCFLGVRLW